MAQMQIREALRRAMNEEMRRDDSIFLMGEEVAQYNGNMDDSDDEDEDEDDYDTETTLSLGDATIYSDYDSDSDSVTTLELTDDEDNDTFNGILEAIQNYEDPDLPEWEVERPINTL